MKEKVKQFPITEYQRIRNRQREFAVPCKVSDRWLVFDRSSSALQGGEFISLSVMTIGMNGSPKKLCSLIITRENLLEVLSKIKRTE
jgi:hypothetical protein